MNSHLTPWATAKIIITVEGEELTYDLDLTEYSINTHPDKTVEITVSGSKQSTKKQIPQKEQKEIKEWKEILK